MICCAHVGGGVSCGFIHVFCTCRRWCLLWVYTCVLHMQAVALVVGLYVCFAHVGGGFIVGLYMCFAHAGGGVCCGFIHVFCTCRRWRLLWVYTCVLHMQAVAFVVCLNME